VDETGTKLEDKKYFLRRRRPRDDEKTNNLLIRKFMGLQSCLESILEDETFLLIGFMSPHRLFNSRI
jgi:hypothetical protein